MDINIFSGNIPGSDFTMASVGSTDHPDWHDSCSSMVLGHKHGLWLWPRPLVLTLTLMVLGVIDINIDPGYSKTMNPDMTLDSSPGSDATLIPTSKQAANNSQFLITLASSELFHTLSQEPLYIWSSPITPPSTCSSLWHPSSRNLAGGPVASGRPDHDNQASPWLFFLSVSH